MWHLLLAITLLLSQPPTGTQAPTLNALLPPLPHQAGYTATGYPSSYPTAQPAGHPPAGYPSQSSEQAYPPPPAGYPGTYPPQQSSYTQAPYGQQQQQQPWGQPAAGAAGYGTIEMGAPAGGSTAGMYPQVNAGVGAGTNCAPPPAGYPPAGQQRY